MTELPFRSTRRDLLSFLAVASSPLVIKNMEARKMPDVYQGNLVLPDSYITVPMWGSYRSDHVPDGTLDRLTKALDPEDDWGRFDITYGLIYDTLTIRRGTITPHYMTIFTDVGGNSGKTLAQTNMSRSSALNAPEQFLIDRIYAVTTTVNESFVRLCRNFSFALLLGQKFYGRVPLPVISNLCGDVKEDRAIDYRSTGGLGIKMGQHFYGMMDGEPTSIDDDVDIKFCLEGVHARGKC